MSLTVSVSELVNQSDNALLAVHSSWERVKLEDVAKVLNGYAFESKFFNKQGGLPLIRIRDVGKSTTDCCYTGPYDSDYLVNEGDLIVGMDGDFKSSRWAGRPALLNQRVCKIEPTAGLYNERFLEFALPGYLDEINKWTSSQTVKHLSSKDIKEIPLPLPPLPEQHCIVAAVEALFARLDAANARLERVPGILKQFRQAVLAAACDGRLTEDWRQTNVVFECEADYLAASRAVLNNEELSPAFSHTVQKDLPSMWKHVTFGSLGDWKSGATPSKSNPNFWISGQIPWVSPKDMKTEAITDSIDHITTEAVEKTNLHILPKDSLIFVVRGMILARDFPVALTEHEVTINQDMRALIPSGCVYPRYLLQALQNQAHHILRAVRSSTHGTKRLESPTLKTWPIALPPLPEQNEIVRRVDALFALADKIEAEVAAAHAKTETMRQSILAQAFSGRLVPTEAELAQREGREYEPASVLLERIHSEKKEKTGRRGIQSTLV